MKLKINYDLLEKIYESGHGPKLQRSFFKIINSKLFLLSLISSGFLLEDITTFIESSVVSIALATFCHNRFCIKLGIEFEALNELEYIIRDLESINVYTDLELLKHSEIIETNYKMEFSDGRFPVPKLKQDKYISVPLSNGEDETLHQEHYIGYKDYDLSVGSPTKKLSLRTVKQN